jgi:hypothetical protein
MGNRGTTPSWDEEQIRKFGFFEHLHMVARPFRARAARRDAQMVSENIDAVLAVVPTTEHTEEFRARISYAIPRVITCLSIGESVMTAWQHQVATEIHADWTRRTGQKNPTIFPALTPEEQAPFHKIVATVTQALEKK